MPDVGVPKEEFEKELDRVQLSRRHADIAFAWMRDKGRQGVYDIWYHGTAPVRNSAYVALYDGNKYFRRQAAKYIYLFALNEKDGLDEEPPFEKTNELHRWNDYNFGRVLEKLGIPTEQISKSTDSETNTPRREDSMTKTAIELLRQFYQIIFHGPPGTGKTHCAKQLLPELLESPDSTPQQLQSEGRWDIVQFHPSYNYEDFVRGVQVKTKGEQVVYETLNRTFGDMCRTANAEENRDKKFALIIDEINRANVSAVLGELIYALEYRGEPINTPYDAGDGKALTIPKNLYVIGTMNTADRTIGQIDYAVRRRFAFVACPPDEQVIRDNSDGVALNFFNRVNAIFDRHISSDFDAADVRVGHSYFLATGSKLGYKLVYQAVPILREYVKDGVLKQGAESEIQEIEDDARALLAGKSLAGELAESDSSADDKSGGSRFYRWKTNEREGFDRASRVWLAFVRDYAKEHESPNLESLMHALSEQSGAIQDKAEASPSSCYVDSPIPLKDGSQAVVSYHKWTQAEDFADKFSYHINPCYFVNIGEGKEGARSRSWTDCREYGFVCAGGQNKLGKESFREAIEKLQEGDSVFAYWGGEGVPREHRGFIALGTVLEPAVKIDEFKVGERLLSECESNLKKGVSYREAYPRAFAETEDRDVLDYAVRVNWEKILSDEEIVQVKWTQHTVRERIDTSDFIKLRNAFNLGPKEGG